MFLSHNTLVKSTNRKSSPFECFKVSSVQIYVIEDIDRDIFTIALYVVELKFY